MALVLCRHISQSLLLAGLGHKSQAPPGPESLAGAPEATGGWANLTKPLKRIPGALAQAHQRLLQLVFVDNAEWSFLGPLVCEQR